MKWLMLRPSSLLRLIRARRAAVGRSLGRAPIWAAYRPFIPTGLKDYAFFQGEGKNNAKVSLSFVKKAFLTWVNGIPENFRRARQRFFSTFIAWPHMTWESLPVKLHSPVL